MFVIVPLADQHGDEFELYFNGQKQRLAMPLEFNGLLALRSLAFHLGVPEAPKLSKKDLLAGIKQRLSFIPHKEARKTWPELDRVQAWLEGCDYDWETFEENLAIMRDLIPRVQAETPWLLPHALVTVEWIAELVDALRRYEERETAKAEAKAEAAAADPKEPEALTT